MCTLIFEICLQISDFLLWLKICCISESMKNQKQQKNVQKQERKDVMRSIIRATKLNVSLYETILTLTSPPNSLTWDQ